MCDFMAHITHVKKREFSPCIWTWKLRDPARASQFQSSFKVKTIISVAAVGTAAGADAETANHVESAWSEMKDPLPSPQSVVSPITTSRNLKPGGGVNRWMKLYKRNMHDSKPTMPWRKEAWWRRTVKANISYIDTKCVKKHAVWQADGPPKPGPCWRYLCTQWCWWACAHWQTQDGGTLLDYSMLNLSG